MSNENNNEVFEYTYSAAMQEEVKKIREKYTQTPKEEDKLETLRRLDASVTKKGTILSLISGILGTLIFGTGMCCCLVWNLFIPGVLVGLIGLVGVLLAYPSYSYVTKKEREKIAPQILSLTEELMK
ncbi:MAG: hypothetical protein IJ274_01835 [Lachnospiraceae bacterium]|nr:hypothetical protein [Lachnospiraceae bacterium]